MIRSINLLGVDISRVMADSLKVPYFRMPGYAQISINGVNWNLVSGHGKGGGKKRTFIDLNSYVNKLDTSNASLAASNVSTDATISKLEAQNERIKQELGNLDNNTHTRRRMLQLSQDKNIYKMKVIYTLVAVILCIIILMLALYSSTK